MVLQLYCPLRPCRMGFLIEVKEYTCKANYFIIRGGLPKRIVPKISSIYPSDPPVDSDTAGKDYCIAVSKDNTVRPVQYIPEDRCLQTDSYYSLKSRGSRLPKSRISRSQDGYLEKLTKCRSAWA